MTKTMTLFATTLLTSLLVLGPTIVEAASVAYVASVDRPDNCLRVRSGPDSSTPVIGCLSRGEKVRLTGATTNTGWAKISSPVKGWVYRSQLRGPAVARSYRPARTYTEDIVTYETEPAYVYETVPDDTYYYSSGRSYYPWWRHNRVNHGYTYRGDSARFRSGNVGVRVGTGSVGVRAGNVGVRVGPGGVGVRVR
jgi:uncharacterized protein YraI